MRTSVVSKVEMGWGRGEQVDYGVRFDGNSVMGMRCGRV